MGGICDRTQTIKFMATRFVALYFIKMNPTGFLRWVLLCFYQSHRNVAVEVWAEKGIDAKLRIISSKALFNFAYSHHIPTYQWHEMAQKYISVDAWVCLYEFTFV